MCTIIRAHAHPRERIGKSYNSIQELDDEIYTVTTSVKDAAMRVLPKRNPQKVQKKWYRDSALCRLSKEKKVAWDSWQKEGRPNNGPI